MILFQVASNVCRGNSKMPQLPDPPPVFAPDTFDWPTHSFKIGKSSFGERGNQVAHKPNPLPGGTHTAYGPGVAGDQLIAIQSLRNCGDAFAPPKPNPIPVRTHTKPFVHSNLFTATVSSVLGGRDPGWGSRQGAL